MKGRGRIRGRFGGFAAGHFGVSLLGSALVMGEAQMEFLPNGTAWSMVLTALLMLLYLPAGYGVSRLRQWPLPDGRTGVKAVLYPAFCAWMYAAIGSVLLCGGTFLAAYEEEHGLEAELPALAAMCGMVLLVSTVVWACPSFLLMLLTVAEGFSWGHDGQYAGGLLGLGLLAAAFLPPLLFHLGALAGARKKMQRGGEAV